MNQTSLAQQILDEDASADEEGTWIVVYDFRDRKPCPRFWVNLRRLKELADCRSIQYSVVVAGNRRTASAVAKLASHYGAEVAVFRGEAVAPT
ncbi:hypothetical protein KAT55_04135 [Candidatus Bathyarchaeota archaeon]|nr:hypothetical protein [Candidatus Bathyarchaeota archaeon]